MLGTLFSLKGYSLIAVSVALVVFFITFVFGSDVAFWARSLRFDAALAGQSGLGRMVANPIIFVAENGVLGAAVAGAMWPFVVFWFLLILFVLLVIVGAGVTDEATTVQLWSLLAA